MLLGYSTTAVVKLFVGRSWVCPQTLLGCPATMRTLNGSNTGRCKGTYKAQFSPGPQLLS